MLMGKLLLLNLWCQKFFGAGVLQPQGSSLAGNCKENLVASSMAMPIAKRRSFGNRIWGGL